MYTFEDKIKEISTKDLLRIINTDKEYIIVNFSVFNSGAAVWVTCTNTYKDIFNSSTYNGYDFIFTLYQEELYTIIKVLLDRYKTMKKENSFDILSNYNYKRLKKLYKDYSCRW